MATSDKPTTPVDDRTLDILAELQARCQDGYCYLAECVEDPNASEDGLASGLKKLRFLGKQYINGIAKLRRAVSGDELRQQRRELTTRLERGWEMEPTERLTQEQIDQQFELLLARYVVVCDALTDPSEFAKRVENNAELIQALVNRRYMAKKASVA